MRSVEHRVGDRHLGGQRRARRLRPHRRARHHDHRLQARGRLEARRLAVRADDEAAVQRGGDVVGMALELGGQREDVGIELEEMVGGDQAGHVGGGARAQPAAERDLRLDAEAERLGVGQPGEAAHGEVAPVARDLQVGVDAETPGLLDLELHVQGERARESVEPRAEIRARSGHPDEAATAHRGGTLVVVDSRRCDGGGSVDTAGHEPRVRRARARARGPVRGARARGRRAAGRCPGRGRVGRRQDAPGRRARRPRAGAGRARAHRRLRRPRRRRAGLRADRQRAARPRCRRARRRRGGPGAAAAPARRDRGRRRERALAGARVRAPARPAGTPGPDAAPGPRLRGRALGRPLLARLPGLLRAQRAPPARAARRHLPHR